MEAFAIKMIVVNRGGGPQQSWMGGKICSQRQLFGIKAMLLLCLLNEKENQ